MKHYLNFSLKVFCSDPFLVNTKHEDNMEFFLCYAYSLAEGNTILLKGIRVDTQKRYIEAASRLVMDSNGAQYDPRYERFGGKMNPRLNELW